MNTDDILHAEAWCALALWILSPVELTVAEACRSLAVGRRRRNRVDIVAPAMARMRDQEPPVPWDKIAALYGITKHSAYSIVSRWRRRDGRLSDRPGGGNQKTEGK